MTPLVFLHGFNGSPYAWDDVVARLPSGASALRPMLAGHGPVPAPGSFVAEVDRIASLIAELPGPVHVCGYSLGGRLAIGLVARHAKLLSRVTLIGANVGLASETDRVTRAEQDDVWASMIEREGVAAFIDRWEAQPLFATQLQLPEEVRAAQRTRRLDHDAQRLGGAMRALSLGRMPHYAEALAAADVQITLVSGELDAKFTDVARRLLPSLRRGRHHIVEGAGHNVVLERPAALSTIILETA